MIVEPQRFSLAIRLGDGNINLLRKLKLEFRDMVGGFYGSVNAEGHISLLLFLAYDYNIGFIESRLKMIISRLSPFTINFGGYKAVGKAFFVELEKESFEMTKHYASQILSSLRSDKNNFKNLQNVGRNPHATIGRALTNEQLILTNQLPSQQVPSYFCDCFVIRRFNEEKRQYDVIATLPLQGLPGNEGNQLTLF